MYWIVRGRLGIGLRGMGRGQIYEPGSVAGAPALHPAPSQPGFGGLEWGVAWEGGGSTEAGAPLRLGPSRKSMDCWRGQRAPGENQGIRIQGMAY
jgi:hypothetical protein